MGQKRKGKDLTGQRFGRLTIVKAIDERKNGSVVWKCNCDCGNEVNVSSATLIDGRTKSCGCLRSKWLESFNEERTDFKEGTLPSLLKSKVSFSHNTSEVRGVSYSKTEKVWVASLTFKGKRVLYKRFPTKKAAILARKRAEAEYYEPILEKYEGA